MTGAAAGVSLRRANMDDAEPIASVFLDSFHATYDFPLAHTDDEVRGWVADHVVPMMETWVAEAESRVVALLGLDEAGIGQLYVDPAWHGRGIGRRLVDLAKERRPAGLELCTFQVNDRARRFYERNGFTAVRFGDGSSNEEGKPDVLYRWRP